MNKEVIVKITGYQKDQDGNTDVTEEISNAQYFLKNNTHYILVEDEKTARTARYRFNHRSLEVIKNGDIHAKIVFETNKCCEAIYRTPYGRMPFVFSTKSVTLEDTPEEIQLEVCYLITNNDKPVSENKTVINIKNR